MFEKKAKEWIENNLHSTEEDYIKAFKDGAEFGYNKANEYAKTIIQDLLNNSDEYARQRAMDFLKAERKDICKAKHMVPETPHYGKESRAVPCYTMGSCNDCGLFLEV